MSNNSLSASYGSGKFLGRENLVTLGLTPNTHCFRLPRGFFANTSSFLHWEELVGLVVLNAHIFLQLFGQHVSMAFASFLLVLKSWGRKSSPCKVTGNSKVFDFVKSKRNHEIFYSPGLPRLAFLKTILKNPFEI